MVWMEYPVFIHSLVDGHWVASNWASLVAQMIKSLPAMWGDPGSISGLGRSPGERNGYLLQYFSLENTMDRGAWWAIVHGVTSSKCIFSSLQFSHSVVSNSL